MDGAKVKNIILVLLALVNLFLLSLVLHDRAEVSGIRRQAQQDVQAAYEAGGIRLLADVPWSDSAAVYSLHRDLDAEYAMAKKLLGKCTVQDLGGNILFYQSEKGGARFRGTGEFQIMPTANGVSISGSALDTALRLLRDLGLQADRESAVINADGELTHVILTCAFRGNRVYNCTVDFLFSKESLILIDGRRPLERTGETGTVMLDAATVLMRHLAEIREHGIVCSEIRRVELGYQMTATASGEGTMSPFWCIETDVGTSYVNGLTGKTESVM